jgi:hypothetical protein
VVKKPNKHRKPGSRRKWKRHRHGPISKYNAFRLLRGWRLFLSSGTLWVHAGRCPYREIKKTPFGEDIRKKFG